MRGLPDGAADDTDGWNARFVLARRDRAPDDLVRELDASHRNLRKAGSASARGVRRRGPAHRGAG